MKGSSRSSSKLGKRWLFAWLAGLMWSMPLAADEQAERMLALYTEQIETLRQNKGAIHADLIEPYQSLGEIYFQQKDYAKAGGVLSTAVQLHRVNHGFFNQELIPSLDRLALTYWFLKDHDKADRVRNHIAEIKLYRRDRKGLEAILAYDDLATWYQTTSRYKKARVKLKEIINILKKNIGASATELGPYLIRIADTYKAAQIEIDPELLPQADGFGGGIEQHFYLNAYLTPAVAALKRAQAVYKQSPDDKALAMRIEIHARLGDWYIASDRPNQANNYYQFAIGALAATAGGDSLHAKLFTTPKLLRFPRLNTNIRRSVRRSETTQEVVLELTYTVTRRGHLRDLKVIAMEPPNAIRIDRAEIIRIARYRPAIADNRMVDTTQVRHVYHYNLHTGESNTAIVR